MSFPCIRLLQNSDGPLDSGNRQDSPMMSAILLATAPCSTYSVSILEAQWLRMGKCLCELFACLQNSLRRLPRWWAGVAAVTGYAKASSPEKREMSSKLKCYASLLLGVPNSAVPWELRHAVSALRGGSASLNARPASRVLAVDLQNSRPNLVKSCPHSFSDGCFESRLAW